MNSESDPRIIVLTAPSGSGKTTIANRLLEAFPTLRFSVSATTRARRPHEVQGVSYHFLSQQQFEQALLDDELVEYEEVYPECWYGTLRREIEHSSTERPVILDIDVKGALNVKKMFGDHALILFVKPPSLEVLEARLRTRETESEESLVQRLDRARDELNYENRFDAVIVNSDLETAVAEAGLHVSEFLSENHFKS